MNCSNSTKKSLASSGIGRRKFLGLSAAAAATIVSRAVGGEQQAATSKRPVLDLHVHLDNSTIDQVLEVSRERGIKFGIVEHAGTKENVYPVVLSNDEELNGYLKMLEGKPVYRGVQTEWNDWMDCFSQATVAKLDYVLTDAMTFPGKDGRRVKLWEKDAEARVDMSDRESFMDRFVDWHLAIIEKQPIDILANTSWLPAPLAADYDKFWTPARMRKVAKAAAKHRVAFEISSGFSLPSRAFLDVAREEDIKFTFGSNGRYPRMGQIAFSLEMSEAMRLTPAELFTPAPDGQKAAQRRKEWFRK